MRQAALVLFILFALRVQAQELISLEMDFIADSDPFLEAFKKNRTYPDSLALIKGMDSIIACFHKQGYLEAVLSDLRPNAKGYKAMIDTGPLFYWNLNNINVSEEAIRNGKVSHYFEGSPLPFSLYQDLQEKIIGWYENHGYPFASIQAEDIRIDKNRIDANIKVDPSFLILNDTLRLSGDVNLSAGFLAAYTGIKLGQPYSEAKMKNATELISELTFLRLNGTPRLLFSPGSASLSIPLQKRPANRFDGIAGISADPRDGRSLHFTGQLNLFLVNLMARGERLSMDWQGLGGGTQRLILEASFPYLFSTPFVSSWQFSLHKQDTSYLNIRNRPHFSWISPRRIQLSVFIELQSTQLLGTSKFSTYTRMPPKIDSQSYFYGLEVSLHSKGFLQGMINGNGLAASLAAGSRNIRKNKNLPREIYEDFPLKQNQLSFAIKGEARLPMGQYTRLVFQVNSRGLISRQFFENELFRIGGFRTLKGFDEDEFFASFYSILTGEMRYFTGENSFFSLLFNAAYLEGKPGENLIRGWPWGAAVGLSLETAPGIISLYYAMGKRQNLPLTFRDARIHIGFVNLF